MSAKGFAEHDPALYGASAEPGLVAVEHEERRGKPDRMALFWRRGTETVREEDAFTPFIVARRDVLEGCPVTHDARPLGGRGPLNTLALFGSWKECARAKTWMASATGFTAGNPEAPYLHLNDPVQQYLTSTGRTLFKGLEFSGLRRMQIDIECFTTPGYEFCNAEREGDAVIAVALGDNTGWTEVLSGREMSEKELIARTVATVRERDPDVIEGHNIFNFDLPYLSARARRYKVRLALGRDGSAPASRPGRFAVAERTIAYTRFDVFGRHVVDTLFLVHAYDVTHRSLDGFGLKEAALHFGLAPADRAYIEGARIAAEYRRAPEKVMRYVRDDVAETRGLADLLSRSVFYQTRMLPLSYQNACVRGNATKIDALMVREYLRRERALPLPDRARPFAGGYTDVFARGVVPNVHHCDIRSLYPSLMLAGRIAPRADELNVFLDMLDTLRTFRLEAKARMRSGRAADKRRHFDALQSAFKVLINSFYGYLGFAQGHFSDFDAAEEVTRRGRELLGGMLEWLKKNGARPVELDTDGIYFVPPPRCLPGPDGSPPDPAALDAFRRAFADWLPEGVEMEFDGEYRAMYSYKMKNYALLDFAGAMVIKGAALKSRGLEPFQRDFVREVLRLKLEGRDAELGALKTRFEKALREREWPIEALARTETLQDAPATYAAKVQKKQRPRDAAYELALKSGREYRAGDQVSYYITGSKKSVAVHENSRMMEDWDPERRDENVPYYLAKLEALYAKFGGESAQQELL